MQVKKGDTLESSATYETKLASWYESMGIMVVYMADSGAERQDPFKTKVDYPGQVTHGHLPENSVHGGQGHPTSPTRASCPPAPAPATPS